MIPIGTHRAAPSPVVLAENVRKSFGEGAARIEVLKGVNLMIYPGELTLLMGPSGSGKSTLMATLSGLARPDEGTVTLLDQSIWNLTADQLDQFRMRNCGFIFQGFNLFSSLTALAQVELVLGLLGIPSDEVRSRSLASLLEVGLDHRMHLRPAALSGGEKQRVAIARALAKTPRLLFADEPTSALDKHNGELVTKLLRRVAAEHDAAVLCVTHDTRLLEFADRIIRIDDGRIVADERPAPEPTTSLQSSLHVATHSAFPSHGLTP
jgi:putative ABC transport system ATP-binding protein